jgi:hypothetical protein
VVTPDRSTITRTSLLTSFEEGIAMQQQLIGDRTARSARLRTIRLTVIAVVFACLLLNAQLINAQVNVTTYHNDNALTGQNRNETSLTPANVNQTNFGTLFTYPVDGYVYAQPLYMSNVDVPRLGMRNVVFVATQHDSLYAFDANSNAGPTGGLIWKRSFINPGDGITSVPQPDIGAGCRDIVPEIGITGTPVIDASTNTLYVVVKTKEMVGANIAHYRQRLRAIDVRTGLDKPGSPIVIGDTTRGGPDGGYTNTTSISVSGTGHGHSGGTLRFNALTAHQRPALTLVGNRVYVAWASHCDNGPYHGWVVGYNKTTLAQEAVFNTTPNGGLGGIWQSGGPPASDADGNLYFATGNGPFNGAPQARIGGGGGDLGYVGIPKSVAVKFRNIPTMTGLATNGSGDRSGETSMSGFDFDRDAHASTPHTYRVTLTYDGTMLMQTVTDLDDTARPPFTRSYTVNIPAMVEGNTAHVGFTAATGGLNTQHDIRTWSFTPTMGSGIDHSTGFANPSDLITNGETTFPGGVARLTAAQNGQTGTFFSKAQVDIRSFTTTFTFQFVGGSNPIADGMTFTIQAAPAGTENSDSVLKLASGSLTRADFFTPWNQRALERVDADLGSGGTILIPDQPGPRPRLIVETGKQGRIYIMNRDDMGSYQRCGPTCDDALQVLDQGVNGVFGNPSYFITDTSNNSGILYYHGSGDVLKGFTVANGTANPMPARGGQSFAFPGGQPVLSSNGSTNGLVWDLQVNTYGTGGPSVLHVYNAIPSGMPSVLTELYNSSQAGQRDQLGGAVKFTVPTVANGKVYVGTNSTLEVLGLFPPAMTAPAAATNLTATTVSDTQIRLSWTNNATNATGTKIFRSIDGETFTQVTTVNRNATTFTDTGLMPSTDYFYLVRTTNQVGDSADSNVATARTRIAASVLQVADVCAGQVTITWSGVADDHYTIERSMDGTNFKEIARVGPEITSYTDFDVDIGSFFYRVRAFNADSDTSVSNVAKATLGPVNVDHSTGFVRHDDLLANGNAQFTAPEGVARLTNDFGQRSSFFTVQRVGVRGFTTAFTFRLHEGTQPNIADGFSFIIQGNSPTALGEGGGGLGYAGLPNSIAIKFDVWSNDGEGENSTGLFVNGSYPSVPHNPGDVLVRLDGTGIVLRSQSMKRCVLMYDGTTLIQTITDLVSMASFTTRYTVNIGSFTGDTAYVGFGAGTGGAFALQDIITWTFDEQEGMLPPRAPGDLRITRVQRRNSMTSDVTIAWKCNNSATAESFTIERSMDGTTYEPIIEVGSETTSVTDPQLPAGLYFYRVRAQSARGASAPSNVVSVVLGDDNTPAVLDHSNGFASHPDISANGSARFEGSLLRLTSGSGGQAGSSFGPYININTFTTTFTFHIHTPGSDPFADGMTFVIQGNGPQALGPSGGGLGYGPDQPGPGRGIRNSVAVKFDLYENVSEGTNSTGIFTDGRSPTVREIGLDPSFPDRSIPLDRNVINLHSQHPFKVEMLYDGGTLFVTITDTVTMASADQVYEGVDIPTLVGGDYAFVGFTGGTGGLTATQDVQSWKYSTALPNGVKPSKSR